MLQGNKVGVAIADGIVQEPGAFAGAEVENLQGDLGRKH
jgi:hypothetical protein